MTRMCDFCSQPSRNPRMRLCEHHASVLKDVLFQITCTACGESFHVDVPTYEMGGFNCTCGMRTWTLKAQR